MDGRTLTCVYCGHEYPQDTPAHGDGVLTEHIKICERHPMRKAEQDTALLRSALEALQAENDVQTKAANHWMAEANTSHNLSVKQGAEIEALQDDALELQAKLEDALKDRVALAMALDCGHRPLCEECKLYSPAAQQAQPELAPLSCTWTQEDDFDMPGVYHTSCGEMWSFTEGGIKENNTKFCPHCGGGIKQGGQQ